MQIQECIFINTYVIIITDRRPNLKDIKQGTS